jgi:ABC-2 type transport system permease protein
MTALTGLGPLYRRRVAATFKQPVAVLGQTLTPILWVLVVGPALAKAFGASAHGYDYFSYVCIGQIVFILPFSAMFAGLSAMFDRDWGILRELLVAPVPRSTIPTANTAAVLTVGAAQLALILGLALARGATFHTTPLRTVAALSAAALLTTFVYGLAELLVYTIKQPQIFGTLIPAIGATPYLLSGAIYPVTSMPTAIRDVAWLLPWTHCVAVLRYGLLGDRASGLTSLWPGHNVTVMALLSLSLLAAAAAITQTLSRRRFAAATTR